MIPVLYSNIEYLEKLLDVYKNQKTVYSMGGFGAYADYGNNRTRYKVPNAPAGSYIYDCSGFAYKAIPWGWRGDKSRYGGAEYKKIPELETNNILKICSDVSTDFSKISLTEILYMPGHVGIYAGNGQVVECTTAGGGGVIMSTLASAKQLHGSNWTKHGKLPFLDYVDRCGECCKLKRNNGTCPGCIINA